MNLSPHLYSNVHQYGVSSFEKRGLTFSTSLSAFWDLDKSMKFLEEKNRKDEALGIYEKGMEIATQARNRHAFGELKSAYQMAKGVDEDDWED